MADPTTPAPAADVNPYTGKPAAMDAPPVEKVVSHAETKSLADWLAYDPSLSTHEAAFRGQYGPGADQLMDLATLNLRLAHMGIDYVVQPAVAPAPPADPNAPAPPPAA